MLKQHGATALNYRLIQVVYSAIFKHLFNKSIISNYQSTDIVTREKEREREGREASGSYRWEGKERGSTDLAETALHLTNLTREHGIRNSPWLGATSSRVLMPKGLATRPLLHAAISDSNSATTTGCLWWECKATIKQRSSKAMVGSESEVLEWGMEGRGGERRRERHKFLSELNFAYARSTTVGMGWRQQVLWNYLVKFDICYISRYISLAQHSWLWKFAITV